MIFSYTLIDTFHNVCPRQAHERWWLKIPVPETAEMLEGKKVHKHLENRLGLRRATPLPLPPELESLEPICAALAVRGSVETELKTAVDRELGHTGFFDRDAYIRGVLDVLVRGDRNAFVVDWKTGKNREAGKEPLQLMLSAAYVLTELPHMEQVTAVNVYTKTGQMGTAHSWTRAELPGIWRTILPLVQEIEQAEAERKWPETPSGLCGWCPVLKCQHNRSR